MLKRVLEAVIAESMSVAMGLAAKAPVQKGMRESVTVFVLVQCLEKSNGE